MTFEDYEEIKVIMEHVMVVLNASGKYEESDEVWHNLFLLLREYKEIDASTYMKRFQKYYELAVKLDSYHMEGYSL